MNRMTVVSTAIVAVVAVGIGYWLGSRRDDTARRAEGARVETQTAPTTPRKRKILYYRHPMGLPDTSPVPKKDSMGMDYVPVYDDELPSGPGFVIDRDKLQRLGVKTVEAMPGTLMRTVRAVGTIQIDERRQATVTTKFEGYVTRLYVATTGAPVRRGQPLIEVYSPELVSAQEEYAVAEHNLREFANADPAVRARLESLVQASRDRLRNWDVDARDWTSSGASRVRREILLRSPVDGVVLDKLTRVGQRFMPGEPLYEVASLDTVWLVASVFEQDLASIASGSRARARFAALPGRVIEGHVAFVYPTLETATRTLAVRIELPNPKRELMPGLFGSVEIESAPVAAAVTVPLSAVLDSGKRQLVFVAYEGGRFEAREIELGARSEDAVAVVKGLSSGESVVVDGNFLIDAESNLRAGTQALGHSHGATAKEPQAAPPTSGPSVDPNNMTDPAASAHDGHGNP